MTEFKDTYNDVLEIERNPDTPGKFYLNAYKRGEFVADFSFKGYQAPDIALEILKAAGYAGAEIQLNNSEGKTIDGRGYGLNSNNPFTEVATVDTSDISDRMVDNVNHPKHYTSDPSGVECIQITRHRNFNVGNSLKYLWRAGLKEDAHLDQRDKHIEDLEKAIFYIRDEIARLKSL